MTLNSDANLKKKLTSSFKYELREFSPNNSKVQKFHFDGLFLSKVYEVWAKKIQRSYLYGTEQWCKIWIKPDLVVSKMVWGTGWTFIRAPKSLKKCTLIGSFHPKHIIFKLEYFKRIICNNTEGCCKI